MNIAAGKPVERGRRLTEINVDSYVKKLMSEAFNGYVCIATHGKTGLEEGVLVLHNGQIASSDYDYYAFNKNYTAEEGLARTLNALKAEKGILDSFALSSYQVQLILTLNEECTLKQRVDASTFQIPSVFSNTFEDKLLGEQQAQVEKQVETKVSEDYEKNAVRAPTTSERVDMLRKILRAK